MDWLSRLQVGLLTSLRHHKLISWRINRLQDEVSTTSLRAEKTVHKSLLTFCSSGQTLFGLSTMQTLNLNPACKALYHQPLLLGVMQTLNLNLKVKAQHHQQLLLGVMQTLNLNPTDYAQHHQSLLLCLNELQTLI